MMRTWEYARQLVNLLQASYLLKLRGSLVVWKTKKQHTVSKSLAEAEYCALGSAVSEVVWAVGLLKESGFDGF